ncbi:unnamed protein product [Sphacelaria rigidula]
MCICLNCSQINNCYTYKFVAIKHGEQIKSIRKNFYPQSPILFGLNKFSKKKNYLIEWDINQCLSYEEKPGNWLISSISNPIKNKSLFFYNSISSYLIYDLIF